MTELERLKHERDYIKDLIDCGYDLKYILDKADAKIKEMENAQILY